MDRGGSFTEGEFPDDASGGFDEDGLPLRGWVPPDDRLWLHPSEITKLGGVPSAPPAAAAAPRLGQAGRRSRSVPTAVAALAAAILLLAAAVDRMPRSSATDAAPTGTTSLATALAPAPAVAAAAERLGRSLVGLLVDRDGSQTIATGTAMSPGNLVVTAAAAVAGSTAVTAVSSTGRHLAAQVLGADATTGVAVVKVRGRLDPARFADDVSVGQLAMTACLCSRQDASSTPPAATMSVARVDAVGVRPGGSADLLDGIEADDVRSAAWGAVLADSSGRVAGVLDSRSTGGKRTLDVFVPGWLASDVAQQLASDHRVVHGWLGVTGRSSSGACGAVVQAVMPGAPAQSALAPGDVVVAVDGRPVCDWAQLQATLYVIPPNEPVELEIEEPTGAATVAVALSASPG